MKLDIVSKEIIKTFSFDDVLNPDLTEEEKIIYYEDLLKEAKESKKEDYEDKIVSILNDLLSRGEDNE